MIESPRRGGRRLPDPRGGAAWDPRLDAIAGRSPRTSRERAVKRRATDRRARRSRGPAPGRRCAVHRRASRTDCADGAPHADLARWCDEGSGCRGDARILSWPCFDPGRGDHVRYLPGMAMTGRRLKGFARAAAVIVAAAAARAAAGPLRRSRAARPAVASGPRHRPRPVGLIWRWIEPRSSHVRPRAATCDGGHRTWRGCDASTTPQHIVPAAPSTTPRRSAAADSGRPVSAHRGETVLVFLGSHRMRRASHTSAARGRRCRYCVRPARASCSPPRGDDQRHRALH